MENILEEIRKTENYIKIAVMVLVFFITSSFNFYTVSAQEYLLDEIKLEEIKYIEEAEEVYESEEPEVREYDFEAERYLVREYLFQEKYETNEYEVEEYKAEYEEVYETEKGPQYFRTTANLRLRTSPSLDGGVIHTVQSGSRVVVYDQRDGVWFYVSHSGTRGYMYAEFLTPIPYNADETYSQVNMNGVELLSWSYVRNNVIRNGVYLQVTDVRTGITFWLTAFSQGNHADVVPVSSDDTYAIRRAFGGRWTWEPRAVWVTVDGRTIAASLNGMPHGGTPRSGNGMAGHLCLHFYGSRTHNGNRSHERDHQNRVQDALNAGQ